MRRKKSGDKADGGEPIATPRPAPAPMAPPPPARPNGPIDPKAETEVGMPRMDLTPARGNPIVAGSPTPAQPAPPAAPAAAKPNGWLVWMDERWQGPHSAQDVRQLAAAGAITPDTGIKRPDGDQVYRAGQVKGLFPKPAGGQPSDDNALTRRVSADAPAAQPAPAAPAAPAAQPASQPPAADEDPYDSYKTEPLDGL